MPPAKTGVQMTMKGGLSGAAKKRVHQALKATLEKELKGQGLSPRDFHAKGSVHHRVVKPKLV